MGDALRSTSAPLSGDAGAAVSIAAVTVVVETFDAGVVGATGLVPHDAEATAAQARSTVPVARARRVNGIESPGQCRIEPVNASRA
jgi:hypothetical protein